MNYTFRKATAILFSRIVLTQLDNEQRSAFRKAEKLTKQYTKIKSDLKYLNFCSVNQILPKFIIRIIIIIIVNRKIKQYL